MLRTSPLTSLRTTVVLTTNSAPIPVGQLPVQRDEDLIADLGAENSSNKSTRNKLEIKCRKYNKRTLPEAKQLIDNGINPGRWTKEEHLRFIKGSISCTKNIHSFETVWKELAASGRVRWHSDWCTNQKPRTEILHQTQENGKVRRVQPHRLSGRQ